MPKLVNEEEFRKTLNSINLKTMTSHEIGPKEDCPLCLFDEHLHSSREPFLTQFLTRGMIDSQGDLEWVLMLLLAVGVEMGAGNIPEKDCREELDKMYSMVNQKSGSVN